MLESARRGTRINYIFTSYIPTIEISTLLGLQTGIHNVKNYCFLLGCKKEDLERLLNSKICGDDLNDDNDK